MEFKYRAGQDRRTPPPPHPLSTGTYFSDNPLRGYEFSSGGYPSNVSAPRVFRTPVPVNVGEEFQRELEKKQIQRELEKEEIRREIIAREMAQQRQRRELEEEVMRERTVERVFGITFRERVSMSLNQNQRMNNRINNNIFSGSQPRLPPQMDIKQTNKDKVIILAKPNVDPYGAKRKAAKPLTIDDNNHSGFSVEKKPKQEWRCGLCQITATNEKGLNDHLEGKKHKAKASMRTKTIGLDSRLDSKKLQRGITSTNIGLMEQMKKEDQVVQNRQGLGGLDNENDHEIATSKETGETNALTTRKKFKFYCALCKVQTPSEITMQSHKNGKKHLAKIKKFSQNNAIANFY